MNIFTSIVKTEQEHQQALNIRKEVFISEQGVPESIEIDQYEEQATHFLAFIDCKAVGTGRIRLKKPCVKFERIATLKNDRGLGVGRALMECMQNFALKEYPQYLLLMHAQSSAISFYEKIGWTTIGGDFYEAQLLHKALVYIPNGN